MNLQRPEGLVGGPAIGRTSRAGPETRRGSWNRSGSPGSRAVWRGMDYNMPIQHLDPTLATPQMGEEAALRQPRSLSHVPSSPQRTMRPRPGPHGPGSPRTSRSLLHRGPHPGVSVCMPARETGAPQRPPAKRVVPDSDDFGALGARVMNLSRHRAGSRAAPFGCAHVGRTRVAN